jgi:hypothetical protein
VSNLPRIIFRAFTLVLSGALLALGAVLEAFAAVFSSEGKSWLKDEGGEQSASMGTGVTDAGDREPIRYDEDDVPRGAFSGRRIVRRS